MFNKDKTPRIQTTTILVVCFFFILLITPLGKQFANRNTEQATPLFVVDSSKVYTPVYLKNWAVTDDYSVPVKGAVSFDMEAMEALENRQGDDIIYFLYIDLFQGETQLASDEAEVQTEIMRLRSEGYQVGYAQRLDYIRSLQQENVTYVAAYFTEKELESIKLSKEFGYFMGFPRDGDGSLVDAQKGIFESYDSLT